MRRLLTTFLLLLAVSIFALGRFPIPARAQESGPQDEQYWDGKIKEYQQKLDDLSGQKKTLASAITLYDTQISLKQAQISKKVRELDQLEAQIVRLDGQIEQLNLSLSDLSNLLVQRVRGTYIQSTIDPVYLFLTSNGFTEFISRYKYLRVVRDHDKHVMIAMERSKQNYDLQRELKQEAQAKAEALKETLEKDRQNLAAQKQVKAQLLAQTKSDEIRYQTLLNEALAQKQAFRRFVNSQGGASLLENQTTCNEWGCYYNQRDAQWGSLAMGSSNLSLAEYGCLVTSVAMIASHQRLDIKPPDIAATTAAFSTPTIDTALLLWSFSVGGRGVSITGAPASQLDSLLQNGNPVIAGLYSGPDHFIVIKEKTNAGYIMNDPFIENGADRPLTDKYQVSDITTLRLVSFN